MGSFFLLAQLNSPRCASATSHIGHRVLDCTVRATLHSVAFPTVTTDSELLCRREEQPLFTYRQHQLWANYTQQWTGVHCNDFHTKARFHVILLPSNTLAAPVKGSRRKGDGIEWRKSSHPQTPPQQASEAPISLSISQVSAGGYFMQNLLKSIVPEELL